MPDFKPHTSAKKGEILNQALEGELALYEQVGLFTRAITPTVTTDTVASFSSTRKLSRANHLAGRSPVV